MAVTVCALAEVPVRYSLGISVLVVWLTALLASGSGMLHTHLSRFTVDEHALRDLPRIDTTADPVGPTGYRGAAGDGAIVETAMLAPDVAPPGWLSLGPSLLAAFLLGGRGAARSVLHHVNASLYWERVKTLFGSRVRLRSEGFTSLCGHWRYRAPRTSAFVYWEECEPHTGVVVDSFRLRRAGADHVPLEAEGSHRQWVGLPPWLGGQPRLLFLKMSPTTETPSVPLEARFSTRPRSGALIRAVDWDEGSITSFEEVETRTDEVTCEEASLRWGDRAASPDDFESWNQLA